MGKNLEALLAIFEYIIGVYANMIKCPTSELASLILVFNFEKLPNVTAMWQYHTFIMIVKKTAYNVPTVLVLF